MGHDIKVNESRLDRLLLSISNTYLPFYENHANNTARPDLALCKAIFEGFSIWDRDLIPPMEAIPRNISKLKQVYIARTPEGRSHICGYEFSNGQAYCSCSAWQSTGKRCSGLWSLVTYELCGRVAEYERDCLLQTEKDRYDYGNRKFVLPADTDHQDLIEDWKSDPVEDPVTTLLELDLELNETVAKTARFRSCTRSPPTFTGPVRRRFRSPAEATDKSQPELRGRPLSVRPLHPSRKPQKHFGNSCRSASTARTALGLRQHRNGLFCVKPFTIIGPTS